MQTQRQLFLNYLAQTSPSPLLLEIEKAEGLYLFDKRGKKYIDLISGIGVSNLGHGHPAIVRAIKTQLDHYSYLMVYGEYVQSPQVNYAKALVSMLPENLQSVYFVNSGSEAVEGAMKLSKRATGRWKFIAFKNAYHGSTHGALSLMGDERLKIPFRPLLPGVNIYDFNSRQSIEAITEETAAVFIEPVQGEAGVILPDEGFLVQLRKRCTETGSLLVFDESQTGFGRCGEMFAFQKFNVIPDVLVLSKALGGGLPLGAFIASKKLMASLSDNPALGHITTFGGHPLSCAAGLASLKVISEDKLDVHASEKGRLFTELLKHPLIKAIRQTGLFIAVEFETEEICQTLISSLIERGIITDWFLFAPHCLRISPPLIINEEETGYVCMQIISALNNRK